MPLVTIKLANPPITTEQKGRLIEAVTQAVADIAGKDPKAVNVIIEEVDPDNWGVGGESLTMRRNKIK